MNRTIEICNDLDMLMRSAAQINALKEDFDLFVLDDMADRLQREIRAVRRELLLLDAAAVIQTAHTFGGLQ